MRLVFKKDSNAQISVSYKIDGEEVEFSYVSMIKALMESRVMDQPEIIGEFTDAERKSIASMVLHINQASA